MGKYASEIIKQAKAWLGYDEVNGKYKEIIDTYNAHKPLARNYKVKYTDAWCATFVSAVAIKLRYTDIIPTECSCQKMIEKFKNAGIWKENENRTPKAGDIIFYDWEDDGVGDNKGWSDHVGIVEKVANNVITVIEGNCGEAVKRRTFAVNGQYIRGYGVPKYDVEPKTETAAVKWVHTVVKGDTLWLIAKKYLGNGARYNEIMTLNGLTSTVIHVNQKLKIPKK